MSRFNGTGHRDIDTNIPDHITEEQTDRWGTQRTPPECLRPEPVANKRYIVVNGLVTWVTR